MITGAVTMCVSVGTDGRDLSVQKIVQRVSGQTGIFASRYKAHTICYDFNVCKNDNLQINNCFGFLLNIIFA